VRQARQVAEIVGMPRSRAYGKREGRHMEAVEQVRDGRMEMAVDGATVDVADTGEE